MRVARLESSQLADLILPLLQDLQAAGEDPGLLLVAFFKKAASGRQRSEAASAIPVRLHSSWLPLIICSSHQCKLPDLLLKLLYSIGSLIWPLHLHMHKAS